MNTKTDISEIMREKTGLFGAKLELLSGPMDGMEFIMKKAVVIMGRDNNNDICLPLDILVSRSHARIAYENGEYWLEDMGSRNGTFIGERRVEGKVQLPIGTIFIVGRTEMRLCKS